VEEVGKNESASRRDSTFASKRVVGTGEIEREDSEHCVGCIKGHWIGGIWMVIIWLEPSQIYDRVGFKENIYHVQPQALSELARMLFRANHKPNASL
jgi:hypothetical protein